MRRQVVAVAGFAALLVTGCGQSFGTNAGDRPATLRRAASTSYTETMLHKFAASPDGASPEAGVILDANGDLYGTTIAGGTDPSCPGGYNTGCGTVYEIVATGSERLLYSFHGKPDASEPFAGLIRHNGVFYGTTASGGNYKPCYTDGGDGCGTVFTIDRAGHERLLYQFKGSLGSGPVDGQGPMGGLIVDTSGSFYGTTPFGGEDESGTIFEITKSGKESVLYSFTGESDGARPYSGVIRDASGNLYGVAYFGGTSACTGGCGTIFELSTSGALNVLYSFTGKDDGGNPIGGMVMDGSGSLYGTAQNYGNLSCNKRGGNPGCGTVFQLNAKHELKVLHEFAGSPDGAVPSENLIIDANGNLYGTTSFGGDSKCNGGYSCGTVFEVDARGRESVLHTFTGGKTDGEVPYGPVLRDTAGSLYGTTVSGGRGPCNRGCGVVFKLSPGS